MKKKLILLLLCMPVICNAAYSSDNQEVAVGGAGTNTNSSVIDTMNVNVGTGATSLFVDIENPIRLNGRDSAPMTKIKFKAFAFALAEPPKTLKLSALTIHVYSLDGDDLTLQASEVVATSNWEDLVATNQFFEYTLITPIDVQDGWLIGLECGGANGGFLLKGISFGPFSSHLYRWNSPPAGDKTLSGSSDDGTGVVPINLTAIIDDEIYLTQEIDISLDVLTTTQNYRLNSFGDDISQWIVLEGIRIPQGETLAITLRDTRHSASSWDDVWWFEIDMAAGAAVVKRVTSAGGATDWDYTLPDETIVDGDTYDFYINYSIGSSGSVDMYTYIMNRDTGIGFGGLAGSGATEFQQENMVVQVDDGTDIKQNTYEFGFISLESTNVATPATVDKISHCRKPIVIVGDSHSGRVNTALFPDSYTAEPPTALYVGGYLAFAFGNQRYVIYSGTGGAAITYDGASTRNVFTKQQVSPWGPDRLASANMAAITLSDAVLVFVDGPGINDIDTIENDTTAQGYIVNQVVGYLSKMYSDVIQNQSDIVACSLLPWPDGQGSTATERQAITEVNDGLRNAAWRMNIPYVDLSSYSLGYAATSHPTAVGSKWIAEQVAGAHINNRVVNSSKADGRRPRYDQQKYLPVSE